MHKLGDKVKIRQWSDMEKEFGLCNTDIKCRPIFTPYMRKYCGKKGTIVKITFNNHYRLDFGNGDVHFYFSDDMFEKGEKMKFKVGDKVIGVYGPTKGYEGVVVETNSGHSGNSILCRFKNFEGHNGNGGTNRGKDYDTSDHYYVLEGSIELIKDETIVIYRKDDKVIALDKCTGKKTEAKCHPDDEFDFNVGAKLAFERLLEELEKEQYYNGKIIFTKGDDIFKTGHIYDVIDGKIKCSLYGKLLPPRFAFRSLDDVKKYFNGYKESLISPHWSYETLELIEVLDD